MFKHFGSDRGSRANSSSNSNSSASTTSYHSHPRSPHAVQHHHNQHHSQSHSPASYTGLKTGCGIFMVGSTYLDTVLYVPSHPTEGANVRADWVEQRRGGNAANSAEILSQDPRAKVHFMSSMPAKSASTFLLKALVENGVKTEACVFHSSQISPPKAYIISSQATASKSVISHSSLPDLTFEQFVQKFDMVSMREGLEVMDYACPFNWIHFESRNSVEVCKMIDYVEKVYRRQGWRPRLTISVEVEKGNRPGMATLLTKADVCFFSQLYAQTLGFEIPEDFMSSMAAYCKPTATLFCLWGTQSAVAHHNETRTDFSARSSLTGEKELDVVGVSDVFIAGVIMALGLRGLDIARGLRFACELAGRKTLQYGFKRLLQTLPPDL